MGKALVIVVAALVPCVIASPFPERKTIHFDGGGYHLWTHAIRNGSLDFSRYEDIDTHTWIYLIPTSDGRLRNKFPPGSALLRFPVMVWFIDTSDRPTFTRAEHLLSAIFGALVLLGTCLFTLRTCRCWGISSTPSQFALLALVFGTGLFHYATYDASYSHNDSAFGLAVLLYWFSKARTAPVSSLAVMTTACWLVLLRSTNVIPIAVLTLFLGVLGFRLSSVRRVAIMTIVGTSIGLTMLIALNSLAEGRLVFSGYGQEEFRWDRPMAWSVLTAYEQGLLPYYPFIGFVVVGSLWVRVTRWVGLLFLGLIAAYALLYGYWHWWTLGAGFGHRGFVEILPLAVPVFARAIQSAGPRVRVVLILFTLVLTAVTFKLMIGLWDGLVWSEKMTKAQYWHALFTW